MGRAIVLGVVAAISLWALNSAQAGEATGKTIAAARLAEAKTLINTGKLDEAIAVCKEPAVAALGMQAQECLIKAYVVSGRHPEAAMELDRMVTANANDPKVARAATTVASIYNGRGKKAEAVALLDAAADRLTGIGRTQVMVAGACIRTEQGDVKVHDVVEVIKKESTGNPEMALCLMHVASRYLDALDTERASALWRWIQKEGAGAQNQEENISVVALHVDLCNILAGISKGSSGTVHATEAFVAKYTGSAMEGHVPKALLRIGKDCFVKASYSRNMELHRQGVEICEMLIEKCPQSSRVPAACWYAAANYCALGEYATAVDFLDAIIEGYPKCGHRDQAILTMGKVYYMMGSRGDIPLADAKTKAKAIYERMIKEYPKSKLTPDARTNLARVSM